MRSFGLLGEHFLSLCWITLICHILENSFEEFMRRVNKYLSRLFHVLAIIFLAACNKT